jgi:hypothetical protein
MVCQLPDVRQAHAPDQQPRLPGQGQCHGMVIELRDIAETERGAFVFRPDK